MSEHRSNYRKNLKMAGTLVSGDIELSFFTKNVSLNGIQAYALGAAPHAASIETSDMVYVRLPELNLEGVVTVLWAETDSDGVFNFGFKFLNMRGVDGSTYHYREMDFEQEEAPVQ
jgi:hypothetical protein